MTKKIAIIGTHGTGKSTLVYDLCGELKRERYHVKPFNEYAAECPFEINGIDFRAQKFIVATQYLAELVAQYEKGKRKNPDFYVFDRSILDGYVYSLDMIKKGRAKQFIDWMSPMVTDNMPSYDFLFRTQIYNGGLVEDGTRSIDPVWQKEIDALFDRVLKRKRIKYYTLPLDVSLEKELSKEDIRALHRKQVEFMVERINKQCKK